jgi:hypothetical protein
MFFWTFIGWLALNLFVLGIGINQEMVFDNGQFVDDILCGEKEVTGVIVVGVIFFCIMFYLCWAWYRIVNDHGRNGWFTRPRTINILKKRESK